MAAAQVAEAMLAGLPRTDAERQGDRRLTDNEVTEIMNAMIFPPQDFGYNQQDVAIIRRNFRRYLSSISLPEDEIEEVGNKVVALYERALSLGEQYDSNRPRQLSETEIEQIVSEALPDAIPPVAGEKIVFPVSAMKLVQSYRDRLRQLLRKVKLVPSALAEYIEIIRNRFLATLAHPGKSVGLEVTGSIGQLLTQATLNTFHLSGVLSNVTSGLVGYEELLNLSNPRSQETSTIVFRRDDLDYFDIKRIAQTIEHLVLFDLVDDFEIISLESPPSAESSQDPGSRLQQMLDDTGSDQDPTSSYWYKFFAQLHPQLVSENDSKRVLRLYLKIERLYAKGISMAEFCDKLESYRPASKEGGILQKGQNGIFCVPSPLSEGIVDVYPVRSQLTHLRKLLPGELEHSFLSSIVAPSLKIITIRGISGITAVLPNEYKVANLIIGEKYESDVSSSKEDGSLKISKRWILTIDDRVIRTSGVTLNNVRRLLRVVGLTMVGDIGPTTDYFYRYVEVIVPQVDEEDVLKVVRQKLIDAVETAEDREALLDQWGLFQGAIVKDSDRYENNHWLLEIDRQKFASSYLNLERVIGWFDKYGLVIDGLADGNIRFQINSQGKTPKDYINDVVSEDRKKLEDKLKKETTVVTSRIQRAANYYYAYTVGNNFKALLNHPDIDPHYSYSRTAPHDLGAFGIEAARTFLVIEFLAVIESGGSTINVQHVLLLVDIMTRHGYLSKISRNNIIKTSSSIFQRAAAQEVQRVLNEAAVIGSVDPLLSATSRTIMGSTSDLLFGENSEQQRALEEFLRGNETGANYLSAEEMNEAIAREAARVDGLDSAGLEPARGFELLTFDDDDDFDDEEVPNGDLAADLPPSEPLVLNTSVIRQAAATVSQTTCLDDNAELSRHGVLIARGRKELTLAVEVDGTAEELRLRLRQATPDLTLSEQTAQDILEADSRTVSIPQPTQTTVARESQSVGARQRRRLMPHRTRRLARRR